MGLLLFSKKLMPGFPLGEVRAQLAGKSRIGHLYVGVNFNFVEFGEVTCPPTTSEMAGVRQPHCTFK